MTSPSRIAPYPRRLLAALCRAALRCTAAAFALCGPPATAQTAEPTVVVRAPNPATVTEGGNAVFTFELNRAGVTGNFLISYLLSGPAANDDDLNTIFAADTVQTAAILAGSNSQTASVPTAADDLAEGDEALTVTVIGLRYGSTRRQLAAAARPSATVTLLANGGNAPVSIRGPAAPVAEGARAIFTVTVAGHTTADVTGRYTVAATAAGGAQPGDLGDSGNAAALTSFPAAVSFRVPAGTGRSTRISLPIYDDRDGENAESFSVGLSGLAGGGAGVRPTLATATATAAIAASDPVRVSIANAPDAVEGADAVFTVTASGRSTAPISGLRYAISAGTATTADYDAGAATPGVPFSIPQGTDQTVTVRVPTVADGVVDAAARETFSVALGGTPAGGGATVTLQLDTTAATGAIVDNDVRVAIRSPGAQIAEGNDAIFTVTATGTTRAPLPLTYAIRGTQQNGAQAGDFGNADNSARLTAFPSGVAFEVPAGTNQSAQIRVPLLRDAPAEGAESYVVTVSVPAGGGSGAVTTFSRNSATGTIAPSVARAPIAVRSAVVVTPALPPAFDRLGDDGAVFSEGQTFAFYAELLDRPGPGDIRFEYVVSGSAVNTGDIEFAFLGSRRISTGFEQGALRIQIPSISVRDDGVAEPAEQITLRIERAFFDADPSRTPLELDSPAPAATVTIRASGGALPIAIAGPAAAVDEASNAVFTVTATGSPSAAVTVVYDVAGAATGGAQAADLGNATNTAPRAAFPQGQTLTIPAGTNPSATITLPVYDDNIGEGFENFTVTLRNPAGGGTGLTPQLTTASATATIAPSDAVRVAVTDTPTVVEGNDAVFTVTATGTTTAAITGLTYSLAPGTASAADYDAAGATATPLTIAAGTNSTVEIRVPTVVDSEVEGAETFTLTLGGTLTGSGGGATLQLDVAAVTGTIMDNRLGIAIAGPAAAVSEGANAVFTVTATGSPTAAVTVVYDVAGAATGGAQAADLGNATNTAPLPAFPRGQTLTLAAGTDPSASITLPVYDDGSGEGAETFTVTLRDPAGGGSGLTPRLTTASASATIAASSARPAVSVAVADAAAVVEGADAVFTVTATGTTTAAITGLTYALTPGTASAADYDAAGATASPLTLAAGTNATVEIRVPTVDDAAAETAESFTLTLGGTLAGGGAGVRPALSAAAGATAATGTIVDNDTAALISVADAAAVVEGADAVFTVTAAGTTTAAITGLTYALTPGTASTADYDAAGATASPLTLAAGTNATVEIRVPTVDDAAAETAETFALTLGGTLAGGGAGVRPALSAAAGATAATGTIFDNDTAVQISVADAAAVVEGADAVFTVTATGTTTAAITGLTYALTPGTASTADYDAAGATASPLTLAAGTNATVEIRVPTVDDAAAETAETFALTLGGTLAGGGAALTLQLDAAAATATIADNDLAISIRGPEAAVFEGETAVFAVDRDGPALQPVTVRYAVSGVASSDFEDPGRGSVTLPAGSSRAAIALAILEDGEDEEDEILRATLTSAAVPEGAAVIDATANSATATLTERDLGTTARGERRTRALAGALDRAAAGLATEAVTARFERRRIPASFELGGGGGAAPPEVAREAGDPPGREMGEASSLAPATAAGGIPRREIQLQLAGRQLLGDATGAGPEAAAGSAAARPGEPTGSSWRGPAPTGPGEFGIGAAGASETASQLPSLGELLGGSRFLLRGEDGGGGFTDGLDIWGTGGFFDLGGELSFDRNRLDYGGQSYGLYLGADKRFELGDQPSEPQLLAGVAFGWTRGELDFSDRAASGPDVTGSFRSDLLSVYPYAALRLSPRSQLWLLFGYGHNDIEIAEREEGRGASSTPRRAETDGTTWLASAGAESRIPLRALGATPELALRLKATHTQSDIDGARFDDGTLLRGTRARTWRLSAEAETSFSTDLPWGGRLRPFLTGRVRGDAGDHVDDNWQLAFDLGGGADLQWPEHGVELRLKGSAQVNGTDSREHRFIAHLGYDLGGDGRGLTVALESALEAAAQLDRGSYPGRAVSSYAGRAGLAGLQLGHRLRGEVGYGLTVRPFRRAGLLTPYAGFHWGGPEFGTAAGLRFASPGGLQLGLEAGVDFPLAAAGAAERLSPDYRFLLTGELQF